MNNTLDSHISHVRFIACIRKIVSLAGLLLFLFLSFNSECYAASKNQNDQVDEYFKNKKVLSSRIFNELRALVKMVLGTVLLIVVIGGIFGVFDWKHLIIFLVIGFFVGQVFLRFIYTYLVK